MTHYGVMPARDSVAGMATTASNIADDAIAAANDARTGDKDANRESKDGDDIGSNEGSTAADETADDDNDTRKSGLLQLFGSLGIAMRLKKIAHRIHDTLLELPHFSVLCQTGQTEAVRAAVESADVDEKSERGSTPLMHASWFGHTEVIQILLEKGANVNLQNMRGNTALHFAYENGHHGIVKVSRFCCPFLYF